MKHWQRAEVPSDSDYQFAKYNTAVNVLSYSPQEYGNLAQVEGWDKRDTDTLFELCKTFDLRWVISTRPQ